MSIAEEKAWASALATKYGIREPTRARLTWAEDYDAFRQAQEWTTGPTPATTATAS